MFEFWLADENVIFSAALALMLLIGLLQAIGVGDFADGIGVDADIDGDMADASGGGLLAVFGLGRLPLLMLIVIFLAIFGIVGLSGQHLWASLTGSLMTAWIAAPVAAFASLPLTGLVARPLARIMPRDETTAVGIDTLIGRFAVVQTGNAQSGSAARARVKDMHGHTHYVMVEPDNAGQVLVEGEEILLIRRENDLFMAISRGNAHVPRLGD